MPGPCAAGTAGGLRRAPRTRRQLEARWMDGQTDRAMDGKRDLSPLLQYLGQMQNVNDISLLFFFFHFFCFLFLFLFFFLVVGFCKLEFFGALPEAFVSKAVPPQKGRSFTRTNEWNGTVPISFFFFFFPFKREKHRAPQPGSNID